MADQRPNLPVLDVEQVAMILSMEAQQRDDTGPGLIDMFEQDATDSAQRLAAAAERGDRQVVAREAHTLKGAASLYALPRLTFTASQFEEADRDESVAATRHLVQQLQRDLADGVAALKAAAAKGPPKPERSG